MPYDPGTAGTPRQKVHREAHYDPGTAARDPGQQPPPPGYDPGTATARDYDPGTAAAAWWGKCLTLTKIMGLNKIKAELFLTHLPYGAFLVILLRVCGSGQSRARCPGRWQL